MDTEREGREAERKRERDKERESDGNSGWEGERGIERHRERHTQAMMRLWKQEEGDLVCGVLSLPWFRLWLHLHYQLS